MKNKNYCLNDFIKLYNLLSDKDVLKQVKEELEYNKRQQKEYNKVRQKIVDLQSKKFNCSPYDKEELERKIKALKILSQSNVFDDSSKEEKRECLNKSIERLIPLLEEVIYYIVCLEEK